MDETALNSTGYSSFLHLGTLGDEILHRIIEEELLKLPIQLRRQSLIMSDDQHRFILLLNHIRHGKRLTRTGNT